MNLSLALEQVAQQHPNKEAYIFNNSTQTYKELNESIDNFARNLASLGIGQGDHIGILLGNCPQFIVGLYGALRVGATVIPINPTYTADEISYILKNGDVKAVVILDKMVPLFEHVDAMLPLVNHYFVVETSENQCQSATLENKLKSFSSLMEQATNTVRFPELNEDDTAIILYTSGTTGKPKGAMLTHKNVYSNAKDSMEFLNMGVKDTVIATLPMFHVFCLTVALNGPLISGSTVLIVPQFSPNEIFQLTKEYKATVFAGVPTMYNFLYQLPEGNPEDLQSLNLCISGGASMPVALLENFEKKFNVRVSEGYGLSEASPVTCFNPLDRPRKAGSIGTNIVNVENKVVDPEGKEVAVGEVGELVVKGPNVMKGYYKLPEETAAALKGGWLHTGDLAKQDEDGYFYIVDRKKDMIIVGGYNVYPREVEEVLYNHPEVVEAAVVGVPDPNYGEAVRAFVVIKNDSPLTESLLHEYCQEHLAKYKVPNAIDFLDELPKNTTGKILRRALRDQLASSK